MRVVLVVVYIVPPTLSSITFRRPNWQSLAFQPVAMTATSKHRTTHLLCHAGGRVIGFQPEGTLQSSHLLTILQVRAATCSWLAALHIFRLSPDMPGHLPGHRLLHEGADGPAWSTTPQSTGCQSVCSVTTADSCMCSTFLLSLRHAIASVASPLSRSRSLEGPQTHLFSKGGLACEVHDARCFGAQQRRLPAVVVLLVAVFSGALSGQSSCPCPKSCSLHPSANAIYKVGTCKGWNLMTCHTQHSSNSWLFESQ